MKTLVLLSLIAGWVFAPPPMTPRPAFNLHPNGVVNAASVPRLMWKQGGLFATVPQPPPAAYFRICIYDMAAGQTCESPAFHWMYAAGAAVLHPTPVHSPLTGQQISVRYSFEVPANRLQSDRPYRWNVGACKSNAPGSCAYPEPAVLYPSSRNLTVTGIEEGIRTSYLSMATEVTNTGSSDAGPFEVASVIIQAFYDEETGKCATRSDSETSYRAVTAAGEFVSVLPSDNTAVVGIPYPAAVIEAADAPRGLDAGSTDVRTPLEVELGPALSLPAAFLFITRADNGEDILEYDESDNGRAECHVVYP